MGLILDDIVEFWAADKTLGVRTHIAGGYYIWETDATFGGTTVSLEVLGADGATYKTVATATTNAPQGVDVAAGATMRVTRTGGSPSAMYSRMSRVPE